LLRIGAPTMDTTETSNLIVEKKTSPSKPIKAAKPQRRMARPAKDTTNPQPQPVQAPSPGAPSPRARAGSKSSAVVALLQREQGATITELIEATGWQPHTTRAALTGLKKKGHAITRAKRDD